MTPARLLAVAALLCLGLTSLAAAQAPAPAPAPAGLLNSTASRQQFLTFCEPSWQPFSICNPAWPPGNFTGYDVEMVRAAARLQGLVEGRDYAFKCVGFSTMISSLSNATGECSASSTGVTITSERQAAGLRFTYPTFKASLGILANTAESGGWGFTRPFSWGLWLALFVTLIVFPVIIFLIEFLSLRRHVHKDDVLPGITESTWRSALTLMLFESFMVTSHGARVVVLCFMFLALLVTSTYTANLAAFVTVSSIRSSVASVADLRGRAVGTSPIYIERLKKYGLQPTPYPFQKGTDYLAWRDLVASGELTALVRDLPALQWLANTAPGCSVVVLQETLEPFDYGIAFHVNSSDALVQEWSRAVLRLQESGTLEALWESWVVSQDSGCQTYSTVNRGEQPVSFQDLFGLWASARLPAAGVILGVGIVVGTLVMVGQRSYRRYRRVKKEGSEGTAPRSPDAGAQGGPMPPLQVAAAFLTAMPKAAHKTVLRVIPRRNAGSRSGRRGGKATAAGPGSKRNGSGWEEGDLESAASVQPSVLSSAASDAAGTVAPPPAPSPPMPPAVPPAEVCSDASVGVQRAPYSAPRVGAQRATALESQESIFGEREWKSTPRTSSGAL